MNNTDIAIEIRALFEKKRKKLLAEQKKELAQIDRAETAALKPFVAKVAASSNGAKPARNRGARLNPDVQKAILGAMSSEVGYTVNEIADLSHAGRSQVKTALSIAMKSGAVAGDASKRNRKYVLTTTAEQANV